MRYKTLFRLLKFIAIYQLIILSNSAASSSLFLEETDDIYIYLGLNQFGTIKQATSEEDYDLDRVNQNLAESELEITQLIKEHKSDTSRNNIALGALTVILKDDKGQKITKLPLLDPEEKLRAFESTLTPGQYNNDSLKGYYFEDSLSKVPELIGHINEIWGTLSERSDQETQIWNKFQTQQAILWNSKEHLKNLIIETALINYSQDLNELARSFTAPETNSSQEHAEILRNRVFINKNKTPTRLLEDMAKRITDRQRVIENAEKAFKAAVTAIYSSYWHSEQRLIHFLLSSDAFWEPLLDEIDIKDTTSVEVFLHLHSHYNLCPTCRRSLSQAAKKGGVLWKKIYDKLDLQEKKFSFKVLASFRVHYGLKLKSSEKKWLPHKVFAPEKTTYNYTLEETPPLYLKRIWRGDTEEERDEIEYSSAWKKHLEEKYSKAEQSMALEELGKYKMDWVLYINSLISNLDSRVEILENKMKS